MGWLSDNFDFEMFNLKDMWGKIEDNPFSLITGVDPFATGMWNGILGTDNEPIVNQLGGPMGGGSLGIGSGGVYDRAQEAGIDTGAAMQMHDLAEVVAGGYGAAGAYGGLSNIGGAGAGGAGGSGTAGGGAGGGATTYALPETGSLGGGEFINAAGEPIAGGSGSGGMFDFGNMDWSDPSTYMDLMQQMPQGGGQEQQQQRPGMRPMPTGNSGFMPMDVGSPQVYSPPRSQPFGLLTEEDELEKLRNMLGGIL